MKKDRKASIVANTFFIVLAVIFIVPFLYIISISFTSEDAISQQGYNLIPAVFSTEAYKMIFSDLSQLINSYVVTIISSVSVALLGTAVMALLAYPLSNKDFKPRRVMTFIVFFTMLFGGGLIPSYIINTQYYHLGNTLWVYIIPSLIAPYYVIIIRTYFAGLPQEVMEAAEIDGAGEYTTFFKIVLPLSKPVLATVALLTMLGKWNDWNTALIYIRDKELYSLQYLLQRYLNEAEFLKEFSDKVSSFMLGSERQPTENLKFAMVIVAAGPAMIIYPFFQKYFAKGMTIGAVKG